MRSVCGRAARAAGARAAPCAAAALSAPGRWCAAEAADADGDTSSSKPASPAGRRRMSSFFTGAATVETESRLKREDAARNPVHSIHGLEHLAEIRQAMPPWSGIAGAPSIEEELLRPDRLPGHLSLVNTGTGIPRLTRDMETAERDTLEWIDSIVIGRRLCPYAAPYRPRGTATQELAAQDARVLGISTKTPWPTVRQRYHELTMKFHPDKLQDPTDEERERFVRIAQAYSRLSAARRTASGVDDLPEHLLAQKKLRIRVCTSLNSVQFAEEVLEEVDLLVGKRKDDAGAPDTTMLVCPFQPFAAGWEPFRRVVDDACTRSVDSRGYAEELQTLMFHPRALHSDIGLAGHAEVPEHDAWNYTIRSPHPTLHLIKETDMKEMARHYSPPDEFKLDVGSVGEAGMMSGMIDRYGAGAALFWHRNRLRNRQKYRSTGIAAVRSLFDACFGGRDEFDRRARASGKDTRPAPKKDDGKSRRKRNTEGLPWHRPREVSEEDLDLEAFEEQTAKAWFGHVDTLGIGAPLGKATDHRGESHTNTLPTGKTARILRGSQDFKYIKSRIRTLG